MKQTIDNSSSKRKSRITGMSVLKVILILLFILSIGASMGYQSVTLVNWVYPALVCLAIGLVSGLTMWRLWPRLTGSWRFAPNYAVHALFAGAFLCGVFYCVNFYCSSDSNVEEVRAQVTDRYSETRYRSRRVGRRYVRDHNSPYKVWFVEVKLPDGRRKKLEVSNGRYNRLRNSDSVTLTLARGALGLTIIRGRSL